MVLINGADAFEAAEEKYLRRSSAQGYGVKQFTR
jgi:hypothetical protein